MNYLQAKAAALVLSFVPFTAFAQEVGYIDLTDNVFRQSSRGAGVGGGGCGGIFDAKQNSQPEVTVTLLSLDKNHYRLGEEATYEIKVLNSGNKTIFVPWTPHLSDLEPADEHVPYKYRVGIVSLSFTDTKGLEFSIFDSLYGSQTIPGSIRKLSSGEWFIVRGRKKLSLNIQNWGKQDLADTGFVEAKAKASYMQDRGTYSPIDGGSRGEWCIPLPAKKGNELDVTLEQP